jgi:hypothetical protein
LKQVVVSIPNSLLAGGLCLHLKDKHQLNVVTQQRQSEILATCLEVKADILLAEVRDYPPLTIMDWVKHHQEIVNHLPNCKLVVIVDENSSPEASLAVKEAKKKGHLHMFFFSSVSGEYLSAVLESL